MGGTVPSIRPPKAAFGDWPLPAFFGFVGRGRGEATRAGGVCVLVWGDSGGGPGGVGTWGAATGG